ncbi:TlpA family protein disulfide reductase [Arcobacter porcinus]|uniref:Thiol-disulfide oxidoreductase ResA n=1 Tax=Arcobacter porcinus TaxID=1935204 RepID=A0ABX2YD31_9BACT|nr:TlpA disulfide reductase family protein [Arcobacter porcinus]OCL82703.1 Thiol-disulfide oxidoreductase ResA [Arcobacter porcinus]OCL85207.1 Thiol-disulfide oxidoreductase ResA [Arcobacter porcinus]OCL85657.1 Thiol-disulfide oxidoreductase ResA [Arcobacter porcinus]OCL92889.1 Thiol-disulfide oxidoreductase ResA [Arcobacter porcinus]
MKFKALSILLIFISLFFTACEKKEKNDNKIVDETLKIVKNNKFTMSTIDKSQINFTIEDDKILLENSDNKIVLLSFFATWCPPCKAEIPGLVKLQETYKNDIIIVGLLLEDFKTDEDILEFSQSFDINYTITNSSKTFDFAKALGGIKAIPTIYILDKEGNTFKKITGLAPAEMLDIDIKKLLER